MPGCSPSRAKTAALTALLLLTQNLIPCSAQCIYGGKDYGIGDSVLEIVACNEDGTYMESTSTCTENGFGEPQKQGANCPEEKICVVSEEKGPACEKVDKAKGDKDDKKEDKKKKEETPDDVDQIQNDEPEGEEKPEEEESPVEDETPLDQEPDVETEANEEQKDEEQATNKQEEDIDLANDSKNEPEAEDRDEETQDIVEEEPDGEELPDEDEPPTEANQEEEDEKQNADEQEEDTNLANESNEPNDKDEEAEDGGEYEDGDEDGEEYEEEADEGDKDGDEDENEEEAQDGDEEEVSDEGCVVGENMLEFGRSTGPIMVGCANETWYETIETICEDDGAVTELLSESACPEMQECFPCGSVALCMSNSSDLQEECRTDMEDISMVPDGAFDMDATRDSIRAAAESMSDAHSKGIGSLTITLGVISVATVHLWY